MLFIVGVINIVCCLFDNSVVFNDTVAVQFIRCSLVSSFTLGVVRSKVVDGGSSGRWRGSRYQPTEGTGMAARLELYRSYSLYHHL